MSRKTEKIMKTADSNGTNELEVVILKLREHEGFARSFMADASNPQRQTLAARKAASIASDLKVLSRVSDRLRWGFYAEGF